MVQNPPEGAPRISPYLLYADAGAAADFAVEAFGFTEHFRMTGDDGSVNHAEVRLADGEVMMGSPGPDYPGPRAAGNISTVHVYVDDVDAHHARAKAAGATIISEPENQFYGDRRYAAEDPEGHRWHFATHVEDVDLG